MADRAHTDGPAGTAPAPARRAGSTALLLAGLTVGMAGLSFAAVPLYELFCSVTGFGGTPQVENAADRQVVPIDRTIEVSFYAEVSPGLAWRFTETQKHIDVQVGRDVIAFYEAENLSSRPTTGTAVFNVTPAKAGQYFVKVECFCFEAQTIQPGDTVPLAVAFYLDPALDDDPNMDDVTDITLTYVYMPPPETRDDATQTSAVAQPDSLSYN